MKKIILLLIALIVVFISGCDSAADIQPEATFHIDNIEYDVEFTAADLNKIDNDSLNMSTDNFIYLTGWKVNYNERAYVDIPYPQFNLSAGSSFSRFVRISNQIIKKEFIACLYRGIDNSDGELKYIANYKTDFKATLLTGNILSIYWYGEGYFDHEKSGSETRTLSIDLEKGKQMYLSDFVKIDDAFIKKVRKCEKTSSSGKKSEGDIAWLKTFATKWLNECSKEELLNSGLREGEPSDFYVTKDTIYIGLQPPNINEDIWVEIER